MRMIDADALKDAIEDNFIGNTYDINKVVDAQPTIQPEPHWIPVDLENNEPQLEEWVLVSSDGYVMQDCIVERGGEKIWYHGGNIQADDRYMPLPEPFNGGDGMNDNEHGTNLAEVGKDCISRQQAIEIVQNRCKRYTTACVLAVTEIKQLPPIQPTDNLQKLADEIASFKRCVKSDNSDYLTGYLCALSVVEGMIADMRQKGENSESN